MQMMTKILVLGILLIHFGCGTSQTASSKENDTTSDKSKTNFTSETEVRELMEFLAADDLKGRDPGTKGIEIAAVYIEDFFKKYGISPYYTTYRDTLSNFRKPAFNVLGWLEGNDPELKKEVIIVGAHYDHIGIINLDKGDAIANGANDNATGTTTVMEIARYFAQKGGAKRSLIFALFSAEEKGLLGSKHLAKRMKNEDLNLYLMINFEMTGVPMIGKDYGVYITGYHKSNFAEIANGYADEDGWVGYLPTSAEYNLFQRSDNYPFYQEFGVPSHTFCTFDFTNFMFYHKVDDELEALNLKHMTDLINRAIPIVDGMANAPTQEVKIN